MHYGNFSKTLLTFTNMFLNWRPISGIFPMKKNSNAQDLFYWRKSDIGLQPVIHFSYIVIFKLNNPTQASYAIASKVLYANHYFRAAGIYPFLIRVIRG